MTINRYNIKKTGCLLGFMALMALGGCSDDNFVTPDHSQAEEFKDAQIVLEVPIPQGEPLSVLDTRATQAAKGNELDINDLRMYVFPSSDNEAASKKNELLESSKVSGYTSKKYPVSGLPKNGSYVVYLLANFGDAGKSFANAKALEDFYTTYDPTKSGGKKLEAGNLPMVFKSNTISLSSTELGAKEVVAPLEYACAKVRYNIIFDVTDPESEAAKNFGGRGMQPGNLTLSNASTQLHSMAKTDAAYHIAEGNFTTYLSSANHISSKIYSNFTENANAATTGADKITIPTDASELTAAQAGEANKWVLQGTCYLPERYVAAESDMATLTLDSKVGGSDVKHSKAIGEDKVIKRGHYYEMVGRVKDSGVKGADWEINVQDWQKKTIDVDFVHTFLTIDKTSLTLDTDLNKIGEVVYETDGKGGLSFKCGEKAMYDGKPLFEVVPGTDGLNSGTLQLRVSSQVQIEPGMNLKHTDNDGDPDGVSCYIMAGNIEKEIKIKYDIKGFFEITPSKLKIQNSENVDANAYCFTYRTNLGGLKLTSTDNSGWTMTHEQTTNKRHTISKCNIDLKVEGTNTTSEGTIIVAVDKFDDTTVSHFFEASSAKGDERIPLEVEVIPVKGSYRIYFRAINEYRGDNNDEFKGVPVEDASDENDTEANANWIDYWCGSENNKPTPDSHRIYAYTQYGQDPQTEPVWEYTYGFNGGKNDTFTYKDLSGKEISKSSNRMIADNYNKGWYYYDIPVTCQGYGMHTEKLPGGTEGDNIKKKYAYGPLPGATLLIFFSESGEDNPHRVNQHNEAGIQLGDDDDNETWVLFDPSRDPVYNVYNDKPRIEDVTYTIYSDVEFKTWRHDYGKNNIHKSMTSLTSDKTGYSYKYEIRLKAPRGEYDKALSLVKNPEESVVIIGMYNSNLNDWNASYARFIDGSKQYDVPMKPVPNNNKEFYAIVPAEYKGKKVKFLSNTKANTLHNAEYNVPSGNGKVNIVWDNNNTWTEKSTTDYPLIFAVTMFGGNPWTTGYYKGGKWSQTPQ